MACTIDLTTDKGNMDEADDERFDVRRVWLTTMRLLKFQESEVAKKCSLELSIGMFHHQNRHGCDIILYFLFSLLDINKTQADFRGCWPICDKKDEATFRRICCKWIDKLTREDKEARFPGSVGPLLLSPQGGKFYMFLLKFSTYVLYKKIQKRGGSPNGLLLNHPKIREGSVMFSFVNSALEMSIAEHTKKYVENQYQQSVLHNKFKLQLEDHINFYRKLQSDLNGIKATNEKLKTELKHESTPEMEPIEETIAKVNKAWELAQKTTALDDEVWDTLSSVISGDPKQSILDSANLDLMPSRVLLQRAKEIGVPQDYLAKVENSDGKVNLLRLAKFGITSLKLYANDAFRNDVSNEMEDMTVFIRENLAGHATLMQQLQNLRQDLMGKKQALLEAIEDSSKKLFAKVTVTNLGDICPRPLPLTPSTNFYTADSPEITAIAESPCETPDICRTSDFRSSTAHSTTGFKRPVSPLLNNPLYDSGPRGIETSKNMYEQSESPSSRNCFVEVGTTGKKQWTKFHSATSLTSSTTGCHSPISTMPEVGQPMSNEKENFMKSIFSPVPAIVIENWDPLSQFSPIGSSDQRSRPILEHDTFQVDRDCANTDLDQNSDGSNSSIKFIENEEINFSIVDSFSEDESNEGM